MKFEKLIRCGKFEMKSDLNPKALDLIKQMLEPDSDKRANINAILHHSFFNEEKTMQ